MRTMILIASFGVAAACFQQKSKLQHNVDQPLNDNHKHQWIVAPDSDYVKFAPELSASDVLDSKEPIVQRAQYWMDQLDSKLRAEYPDQLKNVPKPVVKIAKRSEPQAFVMDLNICLDIPLKLAKPEGERVAEKFIFDRDRLIMGGQQGDCHPSHLPIAEQQEYLNWYVKPFTGCSLTFEGKTAVASAGCSDALANAVAGGERVMIKQTSHFISFYSEIFRNLNEAEFVSVLAHELGHYYKSHGTADGREYNFFYKINEHPVASRPKADVSLNELGARVLEIANEPIPTVGDDFDFDPSALAKRVKIVSTLEEAIKANLGRYTVEQEADELTLEWMSKLGLDLNAAINAQIILAETYFPPRSVPGWVNGPECRKLYENKWVDKDGKPAMVPVAAWNDLHHSPCFRAYNMQREMEAHKYSGARNEAKGPGADWKSLVQSILP